MSYINHLSQTNSGQDIVRSQFLKTARILVFFIVTAIFCGAAWLFVRDEKFLLSDSAFVILAEALMTIAVCVILIWKGSKIIETTCIQRDKAINALRENEAKFKNFVDGSLIGVVELDANGRICVANDEFLRITGYTDYFLQTGKLNWFDITPLEYKDLDNERFSQAKTLSSCKPYEKKLICADGKLVKVKVGCTYLEEEFNSNNQPQKYIVHVSECNKVEQNPVFGQHWLENLLNILPAPLLLVEPGTAKVTFANRAANQMAGGQFPLAQSQEECSKLYRFTDLEGKLVPSYLTPPIRVALGEKLEGVEINWHERDNTYPVKVFADTLAPVDGYPAICVALLQDVSKLKQLEESSRLVNERLELVLNTTSHLISSKQPEELIEILYSGIAEKLGLDCYLYYLTDKNSQEIKLTSYSGITSSQAKDLELQKFGQGICGTVASKLSAININLENIEHSKQLDTEYIRINGISAYYCCPLISQGQLLGTISFGSRVRRSGFNNHEIGLMQAVCNQIAIAIQRANLINSLQKANCIKDEFLAILSHELRSPLNSILGWSQYLQVRKLDENTTFRALESIERNARELHTTIEELLDMSRTIQGKMQLNIRNCNLTSIIVTAIENLRSASLAKQIRVKLSLHKGLEMNEHMENAEFPDSFESLNHLSSLAQISGSHDAILKNRNFLVTGDSQRLSQVIWNLLSNAIKFTSCGGCIEVRLLEEKIDDNSLSYAVIQVSDTGMGINSELIPYVFDRFRQGDSSTTRAHNGLGLGLSIVRHIVELHGGSVCVESPGVGEGSTFTVRLPLVTTTQSQLSKKKSFKKFVVIN
ncbi:two-component hybrid sensor and regulator [Calothrix parasitica NIES-267]|uniref:histidine kinase n=1 Tax=Calothrix parasitica NIES-267 TaxID=1973488 RepID=A0A1Z4LPW4_9CYAN|nr:two-component hybrid sensor and regulator [Calothrix parasitica NIES-267]